MIIARILLPIICLVLLMAVLYFSYPRLKIWFARRSVSTARELSNINSQLDSVKRSDSSGISQQITEDGQRIRNARNEVDDQVRKL